MLDDRVRSVLARLEAEDAAERESDVPYAERSLAVGPESGRLLFALVAPNAGCEVLEIGGSRGYSTIWLADAAEAVGGTLVSVELDPERSATARANLERAELTVDLRVGDAGEALRGSGDESWDLIFLDAEE